MRAEIGSSARLPPDLPFYFFGTVRGLCPRPSREASQYVMVDWDKGPKTSAIKGLAKSASHCSRQ